MARYRALDRCFVDGTLYGPGQPAGDVFSSNTKEPHPTLWQRLDKEADVEELDAPIPDAFDRMSDEQLDNFYLTKTGKNLDGRLSREKKLARVRAVGDA